MTRTACSQSVVVAIAVDLVILFVGRLPIEDQLWEDSGKRESGRVRKPVNVSMVRLLFPNLYASIF